MRFFNTAGPINPEDHYCVPLIESFDLEEFLRFLTGDDDPKNIPVDDIQYVRDLGLISIDGQMEIANAIYREVIPGLGSIFGQSICSNRDPDIDPDK